MCIKLCNKRDGWVACRMRQINILIFNCEVMITSRNNAIGARFHLIKLLVRAHLSLLESDPHFHKSIAQFMIFLKKHHGMQNLITLKKSPYFKLNKFNYVIISPDPAHCMGYLYKIHLTTYDNPQKTPEAI